MPADPRFASAFTERIDVYPLNPLVLDSNRFVRTVDWASEPSLTGVKCKIESAMELTSPAMIGRISRDNLMTTDKLTVQDDIEVGVGWTLRVSGEYHPDTKRRHPLAGNWFSVQGEGQDKPWKGQDRDYYVTRTTRPPQRAKDAALPALPTQGSPWSIAREKLMELIAATWSDVELFMHRIDAEKIAWREQVAAGELGGSAVTVPFGIMDIGAPNQTGLGMRATAHTYPISIYYIQSRRGPSGTTTTEALYREAEARVYQMMEAILGYQGSEFAAFDTAPDLSLEAPGNDYFQMANVPWLASAWMGTVLCASEPL
jgi:hypothetical protein